MYEWLKIKFSLKVHTYVFMYTTYVFMHTYVFMSRINDVIENSDL